MHGFIKLFNNTVCILLAILTLAFLLRVININSNPPSLYGDELTIVYDAYSLLITGKDQTGASFPLTFSMGAGRPAGYVYFSIPFVALFGPSALGVRALSILSGLGIILLIYLIASKIFSKEVAVIGAILASFNLWDINLSRGGFEAHFALFLTLLGVFLFLEALKKPWLYIIATLSFGLAIHTYPTYKLVLPLFLIVLIWFTKAYDGLPQVQAKKYILAASFIGFIFIILAILQTIGSGSETRFSNINIFSQEQLKQQLIQKVNTQRSLSSTPNIIGSIFHNRVNEYAFILGENYLKNFSLDFLFLHGDSNPRHNMSLAGGFYIVEIILIFLGIVKLWQFRKKTFIFLLGWLFIAPVPTAIISDPHFLRSSFMLPPLIFLSATGLVYLWKIKSISGNFLKIIVITGFIIQFAFFVEKTYFLSPQEFGRFWAYPAKQASELVMTEKQNYDYIILSDRIDNIEFAYPVYAKIDPSLVIEQNQKRVELGSYKFKKFDNVYIGSIPTVEVENFMNNLNGKVLYLGSEFEAKELGKIDTLIGLDGLQDLVLKRKL